MFIPSNSYLSVFCVFNLKKKILYTFISLLYFNTNFCSSYLPCALSSLV